MLIDFSCEIGVIKVDLKRYFWQPRSALQINDAHGPEINLIGVSCTSGVLLEKGFLPLKESISYERRSLGIGALATSTLMISQFGRTLLLANSN